MRIAQVAPLIESVPPPLYGGTERVVSWLTEELVAQGHEVTLFASGDSQTRARLVPGCSKALRLHPTFTEVAIPHLLMYEKLARMAREFDLVHFHSDWAGFTFSRRLSVPSVFTMHGRMDLPDLPPLLREYGEVPLVSISNSQRHPLEWANWAGTVHHGLPGDLYRYGQGKGGYLAFCGRVSAEKRLDLAIRIAQTAGMELLIAAKVDKPDYEHFDRVIKPMLNVHGVHFIGEIGDHQKTDFFGNAAALLFPIDWPEPFGLVMIEAMACGTPVIAYPRGSVPEIIDHGVTGFIVESVDEAVEAIGRLSSFDRRRCRERFEERFTARRMARDYLEVYRRLAGRQSLARTASFGAGAWSVPGLQGGHGGHAGRDATARGNWSAGHSWGRSVAWTR
ncbi:MAG TPA: glycosyltransferase family 4 protein [Phycisphaerales bacterium]|nr:glycosyltransferase family 4 protein [Phycisphaerales bacterium]